MDETFLRGSIMKSFLPVLLLAVSMLPVAAVLPDLHWPRSAPRVRTSDGIVEGTIEASGVRVFKGIPFAAPPVRELRWQPPQPVSPWDGVRRADRFAAQCMQNRVFDDMVFRNSGVSEDCLYLNVWTAATSTGEKRPVLVYFFGGGFIAGDGSELRYDGESMARKGIVAITVSYRLGIFGFLAHPELTAESPHHASGNYALLDQMQALRWVQRNVAAFGGDPSRVTIAGESAGSVAVSAQMASPLSRGLFAGAIGESGSLLGALPPVPLVDGEKHGTTFARSVGAPSLQELRAIPAMRLLQLSMRGGAGRFSITVDGYFLPRPPTAIFDAGEQAHVPLLVGWNSEESGYRALLGDAPPTPRSFEKAVRDLYGEHAEEVLRVYPASDSAAVVEAATALASDRFIAFSTWKWADVHRRTGEAPVYRYLFAQPRPPMKVAAGGRRPTGDTPPPPTGAVHSAEIEYALGNLATNEVYAWTEDDYRVSRTMEDYFANFIRTGDPNGSGLPEWPAMRAEADAPPMVMRIEVESRAEPAQHLDRYRVLDRLRSRATTTSSPRP